jgi:hypothetical protein
MKIRAYGSKITTNISTAQICMLYDQMRFKSSTVLHLTTVITLLNLDYFIFATIMILLS